jgi:pyruvate/2-oxoglutarate/acetoin dehydrogenase E1 component
MSQTYLSSLQQGLHEIFDQHPEVVLLGEDIVDPYGGAFKVSKGLSSKHPNRVLSTPISEASFTGMATGMAIRGMRPIVEIMFGDFMTLCTDQIVNHISKFANMYPGVQVPIVIRTPMGGGRGYGATHSQSLEKLFLGTPGIHIVAPSLFHSPAQMLAQAVLHDDTPVLFIENKNLYPEKLMMTSTETLWVHECQEANSFYPTMTVKNHQGSHDLAIISYGGCSVGISRVMHKLAEEEINIKAIFPGSLQPLPIQTLLAETQGIEKILLIEEGTQGFNWGSEVAALIHEHSPERKCIRRLAALDALIPSAAQLENDVIVTDAKIETAILELI